MPSIKANYLLLSSALCLTGCHTTMSNASKPISVTKSDSLEMQSVVNKETARNSLTRAIDYYNQQDFIKAKPLFEQAMVLGNFKAPRYLGLMALRGEGMKQNTTLAFQYFTQAATQGDITGQYWLAYCYENGIGTDIDFAQAQKWYSTSAQRGDIIAAPALTALGRWYETGKMGNVDTNKALDYYQKASQAGYPDAQQALKRLTQANK